MNKNNIALNDLKFEIIDFNVNLRNDEKLNNIYDNLYKKSDTFDYITFFHNPIFSHNFNIFKNSSKSCYGVLKHNGAVISFAPYGLFSDEDNLYEISLGRLSIPFPAINKKYSFFLDKIFEIFINNLIEGYNSLSLSKIKFFICYEQKKVIDFINKNNFLKNFSNSITYNEFNHSINLNDDLSKIYNGISKRNLRFYKNNLSKFFFEITDRNNDLKNDYNCLLNLSQLDSSKIEAQEDYNLACQLLKNGDAIFYKIFLVNTKENIGIKVVAINNNFSYDLILVKNDLYKNFNISLMLNIFAINNLKKKNISFFDLGIVSKKTTIFRIPSKKQVSISNHKEFLTKGTQIMILFSKYINSKFVEQKLPKDIFNQEN
jgi:hypothetical protein